MTFYGTRAEQLAASIKLQILSKALYNPLPSSRIWCRQLEVGRPTLLQALKILEHEGLIRTNARGAEILPGNWCNAGGAGESGQKVILGKVSPRLPRVARFLFLGRNYQELQQDSKWFLALTGALQGHGIRLSLERCNTVRLKAIVSQQPNPNELCFLLSLPVPYQKLFMEYGKPAVMVGYSGQDVSLPFVTPDLGGSVRHATQRLLRRGFSRLVLINLTNREAGIAKTVEEFKLACAQWPHQPIQSEVVLVWNELTSLRAKMKRLAAKTKDRCGFIVFSPVPVGMLITALLEQGISIPDQAQIVAIEHSPEEISFSAPVTLYGFPTRRCAKAILGICVRYFESGNIPTANKLIELDTPREY